MVRPSSLGSAVMVVKIIVGSTTASRRIVATILVRTVIDQDDCSLHSANRKQRSGACKGFRRWFLLAAAVLQASY